VGRFIVHALRHGVPLILYQKNYHSKIGSMLTALTYGACVGERYTIENHVFVLDLYVGNSYICNLDNPCNVHIYDSRMSLSSIYMQEYRVYMTSILNAYRRF
jgi:hypothetical protein